MAKSRARVVIWCLAIVSVVLEFVKWRHGKGTPVPSHVVPVVDVSTREKVAHRHDARHRGHLPSVIRDSEPTSRKGEAVHVQQAEPILGTQTVSRPTGDGTTSGTSVVVQERPTDEGTKDEHEKLLCSGTPNAEFAGDVVEHGWGSDPKHHAVEKHECCQRCRKSKDCNVWVFCDPDNEKCDGDKKGQCWLKRQTLWFGIAPTTSAKGPAVPWTSGSDFRKGAGSLAVTNTEEEEEENVEDWFKPIDATNPAAKYGDGDEYGDESSSSNSSLKVFSGKLSIPRVRQCGNPANDGYASVNATCLERSVTATDWVVWRDEEVFALKKEEGTDDEAVASKKEQGTEPVKTQTQVAWYEKHASYDGLAVKWGIGFKQKSATACARACLRHEPIGTQRGGPFGALPCNAFAWCPTDVVGGTCFEPDAHTHGPGDCWLKFTETPESVQVNQRGANDAEAFEVDGKSYKRRHPRAPPQTQWTSGVVLPVGWTPSNGTFGPRARW